MNAHEAVIASGLEEGAVIARNVGAGAARRDEAAARRPSASAERRRRRCASIAVVVAAWRVCDGPRQRRRRICRPLRSPRGNSSTRSEIRGEIRPLKSIVLVVAHAVGRPADCQAREERLHGEARRRRRRSSTARTLQRTIQEKQSELKQADAEIEQAQAQAQSPKSRTRPR